MSQSQFDLLKQDVLSVTRSQAHEDAEPAQEYSASGKSSTAFKTISEAADLLGVEQHVLRFWESKFSQIRPMKLKGGRRYYRPEDIATLETIKDLLYKKGFTIKGAKKAFGEAKKQMRSAPAPAAPKPVVTVPAMPVIQTASTPKISPHVRAELLAIRDDLMALKEALSRA